MSEDDRQAQSKSGLPAASPGELPTGRGPREAQSKSDLPPALPGLLRSARPVVPPATPPATPAMAPAVAPYTAPLGPEPAATDLESDSDDQGPPPTLADRLRRLSPAPVLLTLGSIGSLVFLGLAMTSHTTPVAVLMSAGVVVGLIFGANGVIASIGTWRATQDGESGRALLLAAVGGISAVISAGALAALLVMVLLLNS